VILHQGRIIAQGTPDDLISEQVGREVVELHGVNGHRPAVLQRLREREGVTVEEADDIVYVYLRGENGVDPKSLGVEAERVVYRHANLEDVFLKLTGRGLAAE